MLSKKRFPELSLRLNVAYETFDVFKLSFSITSKPLKTKRENRVAAYGFERALAFVIIHPWTNRKWVIDQSEHALFFML